MEIVNTTTERDKGAMSRLVDRVLKLCVGVGFTISATALVATDLVVSLVIGPIYNEHSWFINLGALLGSFYFSITVLEIPLDAFKAPWEKAWLSLALTVLLCIGIVGGTWTGTHRLITVVLFFLLLLAVFVVVLFILVERVTSTRFAPDRRLAEYLGLCSLTVFGLFIFRSRGNDLVWEWWISSLSICILLFLMLRAGLIEALLVRGRRSV
jgi:O-antigen/teichoic acid export membrane protein